MATTNLSNKEFLRALPSDNVEALAVLGKEVLPFASQPIHQAMRDYHIELLTHLAMLKAFHKARNIAWETPEHHSSIQKDIEVVRQFLVTAAKHWIDSELSRTTAQLVADSEAQYYDLFSAEPTFEFSDNDIGQIRSLTEELRDLINKSNLLTPPHKRRILRRLEATQKELRKGTTDIDRYWSFLAEVGIASHKYGEDLKPITDRVITFSKIVGDVIGAKEGITKLPEIAQRFLK